MRNFYIKIMVALVLAVVMTPVGCGCGIWGSVGVFDTISAQQAAELININAGNADFTVLDVRTPEEYETGHIKNAININYLSDKFTHDVYGKNKAGTYLVYCGIGGRSSQAVELMKALGFIKLYNMSGGINAWKELGYPVEITTPIPTTAPTTTPISPTTTSTTPWVPSDIIVFNHHSGTEISMPVGSRLTVQLEFEPRSYHSWTEEAQVDDDSVIKQTYHNSIHEQIYADG